MSQEFFELFLKPCLESPDKFIKYKREIEEEWLEIKKEQLERLVWTEEDLVWLRRCIAVYRILKR